MARKKIEIDLEQFKKLCNLQCTLKEIAGFFDCSEDTIERWCKRTFKKRFNEVFNDYSAQGKISLRRSQFKLAEKSAAMAIWLGKQYLGQRDKDITDALDKGNGVLESLLELKNGKGDMER